jgi:hypothetical protein
LLNDTLKKKSKKDKDDVQRRKNYWQSYEAYKVTCSKIFDNTNVNDGINIGTTSIKDIIASVTNKIIHYKIFNAMQFVINVLNFKIVPTSTTLKSFVDTLEKYSIRYTDSYCNGNKNNVLFLTKIYGVESMSGFVNMMANYNLVLDKDTVVQLIRIPVVLNKIFENVNASILDEELYYKCYTYGTLDSHSVHFKSPLCVLRTMCQDSNSTTDSILKYANDNDCKFDRYCYELAITNDTSIKQYFDDEGYTPTLRSSVYYVHNINAINHDNRLRAEINRCQSLSYMCEAYV